MPKLKPFGMKRFFHRMPSPVSPKLIFSDFHPKHESAVACSTSQKSGGLGFRVRIFA
jgi:hypothetical protein